MTLCGWKDVKNSGTNLEKNKFENLISSVDTCKNISLSVPLDGMQLFFNFRSLTVEAFFQ